MVPCRPRNCGRTGQVEAFLPAWASWTATGAPCLWQKPTMRAQARACSVFHSPVSRGDRKSTRLNSSHVAISYAVFCLKKKKNNVICVDLLSIHLDSDAWTQLMHVE